jgi:hypothetical protein
MSYDTTHNLNWIKSKFKEQGVTLNNETAALVSRFIYCILGGMAHHLELTEDKFNLLQDTLIRDVKYMTVDYISSIIRII